MSETDDAAAKAAADKTAADAAAAKTASDKAATDKAAADAEAAKAAAKPPEKYDLKLPDGTLLDSSAIERTAAYARERGLSNDAAQELLQRDHEAVMGYIERAKGQAALWANEAKADKEIGGDGFAANVETAKRALDRFGSPALKKALDDTGLGNHPELIRLLSKIGKAMADDSAVRGGGDTKQKKSPAEILYSNT